MIYTPLTKKALRLSFAAHKDAKDKSNIPYVYHPYAVAERMTDEISTAVALLHDVVEDTEITLEDLKKDGYPKEVTDALALMTHAPNVPYFDYIKKLSESDVARRVKISDLKHNMDLSRMESITDRDIARREKYVTAIEMLLCDGFHRFMLNGEPFSLIKSKKKTVELRLYDEKRQAVKIGDVIEFTNRESGEKLISEVIALHRFKSFNELYANIPLQKCGYTEDNIDLASPTDMSQYYSDDDINKYGVIGIEIKSLG